MKRSLRSILQRGLVTKIVWLALGVPGLCNTWIVDQANGAGANFTNIPPAIAAAAPGDVIIVRAGTYSPFTLTHGLSLLGQGSVRISGTIAVNAVPAGEVALLYNVEPEWSADWGKVIQVNGCAGTVLLQRLHARIYVSGSSDVRMQSVTSGRSRNSRSTR